MKKKFLLFSFILMFILSFNISNAKEKTVEVKTANYNVMLNETIISNTHYEYPAIVYKGVTYFPMTSDFTQALGLTFTWNETEGITIDKNGVSNKVNQTFLNGNNDINKTYKATIVTDLIKVNGKEINNATEEYPILNFRYVTYFPMTWRFAVDEFGWQTNWDDNKGLSVASDSRFSLDIQIKVIYEGFMNEGTDTAYCVKFSDDFSIILMLPKKNIFGTTESVLVSVSPGNSSIPQKLSIIGFSDTFNENYYPLSFYDYIPNDLNKKLKSEYKSIDFFEILKKYNGNSEGITGIITYDSFVTLEGIYFDDGIHKCNLYLQD